MNDIELVRECWNDFSGNMDAEILPLPKSGSDRRYFRISHKEGSLIGTYNPNQEENDAFLGFTGHFLKKGLPVPEILGNYPAEYVYFQKDLGDTNLYTWLHNKPSMSEFDPESLDLYKRIFDKLILFQTEGIKGLNLDLCYPHRSFDRQSMMWDMNYFKYMLLKLLAVPFNERQLEHDFNSLCDYLLETGQDYFLYRDFQTANIMIVNGEPWFIDYQGGRMGAAQYDVASLLYDAKIPMGEADRETLLAYYTGNFCNLTGVQPDKFVGHYAGFSMIRVMQALGAFGFRGLYEQKPTFTESIVPGVSLLGRISERAESHIALPELFKTIKAIHLTAKYESLLAPKKSLI